jgi:hydrogenase maturation protein HypF
MMQRIKIEIKGTVQGVGFRPFIYRLAGRMDLKGYVLNSTAGVSIEVEGERNKLEEFINRINNEKPVNSTILTMYYTFLDVIGYSDFQIKESQNNGDLSSLILPDVAICDDCLNEMFDRTNRRYLYPFINCTNCGPRLSIIESLPYDRQNTSMKSFQMCPECRKEYENPNDRRFHAQPVACTNCGPSIQLWNGEGKLITENYDALKETAEKIKDGKIIALKGLGGFHLIVDASNEDAVKRLRLRKHREEKPFAVMFPGLNSIKDICFISNLEEKLLLSSEAPIVLLENKNIISAVVNSVAPYNPYLGIMLPYTPLHHLLMRELNIAVVATSGNISDETICIDEKEAIIRLKGIADFYLVHNRPIIRPVDDSIVRVINESVMIIRRARGYAPLSLSWKKTPVKNILAVGAHLKNTISYTKGNNIFISQHIGDLSTSEANNNFYTAIKDYTEMYKVEPEYIIADLHPGYISTKYANSSNKKIISVQHHIAHIASCMMENNINDDILGVAWDGTGYGFDGTIWGGEFFSADTNGFHHIAQFKKFKLAGGDKSITDIKRSAIGLLYEIFGASHDSFPEEKFLNIRRTDLKIILKMLENNINCTETSSVGRLYDAVSYLLGICEKSSYEGQAAMMLEYAADKKEDQYYNFHLLKSKPVIIEWRPIILDILNDIENKIVSSIISARFHNTMAEIILQIAKMFNKKKIVLSGGCFQNILLLKKTINKLEKYNYQAYWHHLVPTNDGGISLGQIALALREINERSEGESKIQQDKIMEHEQIVCK